MNYRQTLINIYLDWFNNYLSIETFAEHNGLPEYQAIELVKLAREVSQSEHPDN